MKKKQLISLLLLSLLLVGCRSAKNVIYLADMLPEKEYEIMQSSKTTIQPNDRLNIVVECPTKPELAIPFKIRQGSYQVNELGNITIQRSTNGDENTYVVDEEGYVDFPVLGRFSLEDMTLEEAKEFLAEAIAETGLIKNPSVDVRFLGFTYTVLGSIGGVGIHQTNKDKFTIIEAIAEAGGIGNGARPDRICIIREENGTRRIYYNDIRTVDIMYSPCYYLRPNDILYVQPYRRKRDLPEEFRYTTQLILSTVTSVISLWAIFNLYKK